MGNKQLAWGRPFTPKWLFTASPAARCNANISHACKHPTTKLQVTSQSTRMLVKIHTPQPDAAKKARNMLSQSPSLRRDRAVQITCR